MNIKRKLTSVIIFILTGSSSFAADCIIDETKNGWTGSISFHCNQAVNLSITPISFELSNGVKVNSAWNSLGETILSKTITNPSRASIKIKKWWPKGEDYILPASTPASIFFAPSNSQFTIQNFSVDGNTLEQKISNKNISEQVPDTNDTNIENNNIAQEEVSNNNIKKETSKTVTQTSSNSNIPFGSHKSHYVEGIIKPNQNQQEMDNVIIDYYNKWKEKFVMGINEPLCGNKNWIAIYSNDAVDGAFVSEAQGYGLEIFVVMAGADPNAHLYFDKLLQYILDHPSDINKSLMDAAQNVDCTQPSIYKDSATDGDISIAFALLLANKQWGSQGAYDYKDLALKRIDAIKQSEFNPQTHLPLLGDWTKWDTQKWYGVTRPSDFMLSYFKVFAEATNDNFWNKAVESIHNLIDKMQLEYSNNAGLVPDFVINTTTELPKPSNAYLLEGAHDGNYYYNSARLPWHLGVDVAVTGDETSKAQVQKINNWIKNISNNTAGSIYSGYYLSGQSLPGSIYTDATFISSFGSAAIVDSSNQELLDSIWNWVMNKSKKEQVHTEEFEYDKKMHYFASTLMLKNMIIMSGNYWTLPLD